MAKKDIQVQSALGVRSGSLAWAKCPRRTRNRPKTPKPSSASVWPGLAYDLASFGLRKRWHGRSGPFGIHAVRECSFGATQGPIEPACYASNQVHCTLILVLAKAQSWPVGLLVQGSTWPGPCLPWWAGSNPAMPVMPSAQPTLLLARPRCLPHSATRSILLWK